MAENALRCAFMNAIPIVNGRGDEFLVVKQDALNTIRVAAAPSFRRGSKPFFGHFNSLDSIEILRKWLYYGGD